MMHARIRQQPRPPPTWHSLAHVQTDAAHTRRTRTLWGICSWSCFFHEGHLVFLGLLCDICSCSWTCAAQFFRFFQDGQLWCKLYLIRLLWEDYAGTVCVEWMQGVQTPPWVILTLHNQKSSRIPSTFFWLRSRSWVTDWPLRKETSFFERLIVGKHIHNNKECCLCIKTGSVTGNCIISSFLTLLSFYPQDFCFLKCYSIGFCWNLNWLHPTGSSVGKTGSELECSALVELFFFLHWIYPHKTNQRQG